jgi:exonuclease SbcC
MRPLRLEIEGLTAFRAKQEVDFTQLDLFVVTGPTGAGKSTILDALVFALYGAIPRMTTNPSALVTHGSTMAKVTLEFAADGETYQVTRRLPKKGAQKATLHRRVGDDWLSAVDDDGVRPVNARIEAIIGLDFDGFTRAVLLPQGKFAEFLRGKPEQRREILVRLLDLGRYERAAERARGEANRIGSEVTATLGLIERQFGDATEEAVGAAEAAVQAALVRRTALEAAEEQAGASLTFLSEIAQRRAAVDADRRAIDHAAEALRAVDAQWLALAPRQKASDDAHAAATVALETAEAAHGDAQRRLEATLAETGGEEQLGALKAAPRRARRGAQDSGEGGRQHRRGSAGTR